MPRKRRRRKTRREGGGGGADDEEGGGGGDGCGGVVIVEEEEAAGVGEDSSPVAAHASPCARASDVNRFASEEAADLSMIHRLGCTTLQTPSLQNHTKKEERKTPKRHSGGNDAERQKKTNRVHPHET